jgi:hypothetical protein
LLGYLWTRLQLRPELEKADVNAVVRETVEAQWQLDAKAMAIAKHYLTATESELDKISVADLKDAIQKASPPAKVQILGDAWDLRAKSWKSKVTKHLLDRTIPIFEALALSDRESRHENFGQLGFALLEKLDPDYKGAEDALTKAIDMRGSAEEGGWALYEFCRAISRIKQDKDFQKGRRSSPNQQKTIFDDIKVARKAMPDLRNQSDIKRWLRFNAPAKSAAKARQNS